MIEPLEVGIELVDIFTFVNLDCLFGVTSALKYIIAMVRVYWGVCGL